MIRPEQIREIGRFNQPHGIKGEISASVDPDVDLASLRCIVVDVDGIYVPFFIVGIRPKSASATLLSIDGVDKETDAAFFQGKAIYALADELPEEDDAEADGFYAEDLVGFRATDTTGALEGEIVDIDDSTENFLFIVETADGRRVLLPVADELIDEIDTDARAIVFDLPDGLLDI